MPKRKKSPRINQKPTAKPQQQNTEITLQNEEIKSVKFFFKHFFPPVIPCCDRITPILPRRKSFSLPPSPQYSSVTWFSPSGENVRSLLSGSGATDSEVFPGPSQPPLGFGGALTLQSPLGEGEGVLGGEKVPAAGVELVPEVTGCSRPG